MAGRLQYCAISFYPASTEYVPPSLQPVRQLWRGLNRMTPVALADMPADLTQRGPIPATNPSQHQAKHLSPKLPVERAQL